MRFFVPFVVMAVGIYIILLLAYEAGRAAAPKCTPTITWTR